MKRILFAAMALFGMALSTQAFAQDWSGPEIGIQGGYAWGTSSGNVNCFPVACAPGVPYSFGPSGILGGGHAGYNWQFGQVVLGIEGDAEGADVSSNGTGHFGVTPYTFHSSMDFDASVRGKLGYAFDRVLLYGTGGVAFGDVTKTGACPVCIGAPGSFESINGVRVGWTAGAGLEYQITGNWEGGIEYRYTDLGSQRFRSAATDANDLNSFNFSAVRLRLSYRFAPPMMAPPPPVVVPAAAPAPMPHMARTFLVFFDFDRYNLTADARRVIDAAAASYRANGSARIDVSGFTDLAGTQAYNLRLSQRRADAVAGHLMKQGVPKEVLDVKWFGKEHPRVPTPDGVREPQNRRVEIMMP